MPVHTPGAIGSSGDDDQGLQQTQTARLYPNSVDALNGMQYPDLPGGAIVNAPRSPLQQVHPASVTVAVMQSSNYPVQEQIIQPQSEE